MSQTFVGIFSTVQIEVNGTTPAEAAKITRDNDAIGNHSNAINSYPVFLR